MVPRAPTIWLIISILFKLYFVYINSHQVDCKFWCSTSFGWFLLHLNLMVGLITVHYFPSDADYTDSSWVVDDFLCFVPCLMFKLVKPIWWPFTAAFYACQKPGLYQTHASALPNKFEDSIVQRVREDGEWVAVSIFYTLYSSLVGLVSPPSESRAWYGIITVSVYPFPFQNTLVFVFHHSIRDWTF